MYKENVYLILKIRTCYRYKTINRNDLIISKSKINIEYVLWFWFKIIINRK